MTSRVSKKKRKELGTLSAENFRQYAQQAIQSYHNNGMIMDGMLWAGIIRHYENALDSCPVKS